MSVGAGRERIGDVIRRKLEVFGHGE